MSRHRRQRNAAKRKRRIQRRLAQRRWQAQDRPMFAASNIDYDVEDRTRGLGGGGIGAMPLLARQCGVPNKMMDNYHLKVRFQMKCHRERYAEEQ